MTARQAGEAVGQLIGAFIKAIAWGAGVTLGALGMLGYLGWVQP